MNNNDSKILKELSKKYAEIAFCDKNNENMALMRSINGLKPVRPAVYIEELPWHEMNIDGQLTLECSDPLCRDYEQFFKLNLLRHKYFPADAVYQPFVPVYKQTKSTGIGIEVVENVVVTDEKNHIISHEYTDQLKTPEDLEKLRPPVITYDKEETERRLSRARELFEGILPSKLVGHEYYWAPWDQIAKYRGVQPLLMDLVMNPELMHATMEKMLEIAESEINQLERLGLLRGEQYSVHCTAGLCDELPAKESDISPKNMWGRGMAQIFGSVSPAMHDEFDISYMVRFMEKFGLVYYGCCEPLHDKIDIVEKIPNLRKISITPWAKVEPAAEAIGSNYVFAAKPNPAYVAEYTLDREAVRKEVVEVLTACKKYGTTCEFVLKDISTCKGKPENIIEWEKTVMDTVLNFD